MASACIPDLKMVLNRNSTELLKIVILCLSEYFQKVNLLHSHHSKVLKDYDIFNLLMGEIFLIFAIGGKQSST